MKGPRDHRSKHASKSGSTKTRTGSTYHSKSNTRHVAYSKTQGRCCTAVQFYSSLFCTFLPFKIINDLSTSISLCIFNFTTFTFKFMLHCSVPWSDWNSKGRPGHVLCSFLQMSRMIGWANSFIVPRSNPLSSWSTVTVVDDRYCSWVADKWHSHLIQVML